MRTVWISFRQVAWVLFLAIGLGSCSSQQMATVGDPGPAPDRPRTTPTGLTLAAGNYKTQASLGFLAQTSTGWVDVPLGRKLTAEDSRPFKSLKTSRSLARVGVGSQLYQHYRSFYSQQAFSAQRLAGENEPYQANCADSFNHGIFFNGVFVNEGPNTIVYRWTLPASGGVGLGLGSNLSLSPLNTVAVTGPVIEVVCHYNLIPTTFPDGSHGYRASLSATANGETLVELTEDELSQVTGGPGGNQFPFVPLFGSGQPGSYRLQVEVNGTEVANDLYVQRSLGWANEWPDMLNVPLGSVVQFHNSLRWDNGEVPATSEWKCTIVGTSQAFTKVGAGPNVDFSWNVDTQQLTKQMEQPNRCPLTVTATSVIPGLQNPAVLFQGADVRGRKRRADLSNVHWEPPAAGASGEHLLADVVTYDFDDPLVRSWSLRLFAVDPATQEQVEKHLSGENADADHLDVPWDYTQDNGEPFPAVTTYAELVIQVVERSIPSRPVEARALTTLIPSGQRRAWVEPFEVTPLAGFNIAGSDAERIIHVNAAIQQIGHAPATYEWTLQIKNESGEVLHSQSDTTSLVDVSWDPSLSTAPVGNDLTVEISARVCDLDAHGSADDSSGGDMANCDSTLAAAVIHQVARPTLKVADSSGVDVAAAAIENDQLVWDRSLLADAYSLTRQQSESDPTSPRVPEVWTITAANLTFKDMQNKPASIHATLHSRVSNVRVDDVILNYDGRSSYVGNYTVSPSLVNSSDSTYTVVQKDGIGEKAEFAKYYVSALFSQTARNLGSLLESLSGAYYAQPLPNDFEEPDLARSARRNFFRYGFEAVEVGLDAPELVTQIAAQVKLQHPAQVLVVDVHGKHDGTINLIQTQAAAAGLDPVNPRDPDFEVSNATRKVILTSCEALDLRDYNNFFAAEHYRAGHSANATIAARQDFGGERWFGAYATTPALLLGYNGPAPIDCQSQVASLYAKHLRDDRERSEVLAWLRANRETAGLNRGSDQLNWLCLNACAYDKDAYYYLAYDAPGGSYEPMPPGIAGGLAAKGIYRIPRSRWQTEADNWSEVPQPLSDTQTVGEKVE